MQIAIFGFDADHQPTYRIADDESDVEFQKRKLIHDFEGCVPVPGLLHQGEMELHREFMDRVQTRLVWFRALIGRPMIAENVYQKYLIYTPINERPRDVLRFWSRWHKHQPDAEKSFIDYERKEDRTWYVTTGKPGGTRIPITNQPIIARLDELLRQEQERLHNL